MLADSITGGDMRKIIITVVVVLALFGIGSCASVLDQKNCQLRGEQLGAEARVVGNRCIVKGWGVVM